MNLKTIALVVGGLDVVDHILSTQTIVTLPPVAQLALLCVGGLATYLLVHLPSTNQS